VARGQARENANRTAHPASTPGRWLCLFIALVLLSVELLGFISAPVAINENSEQEKWKYGALGKQSGNRFVDEVENIVKEEDPDERDGPDQAGIHRGPPYPQPPRSPRGPLVKETSVTGENGLTNL